MNHSQVDDKKLGRVKVVSRSVEALPEHVRDLVGSGVPIITGEGRAQLHFEVAGITRTFHKPVNQRR